MFPRKEETKTNKRQHADRATLGRCAERYTASHDAVQLTHSEH